MKRLSKESYLDLNNNIDVKYGAVYKENPKVVYVTCKSWICTNENIDYCKAIEKIFNNFKKNLKTIIIKSNNFENKFICDFDINSSLIKENKKKYISFEFFIKQKDSIYDFKNLKTILEKTFKPIIDNLVYDLNFHTFTVTKGK